jgi:tight adherence protein B
MEADDMEVLLPFLTVMVIGTLALVFYLGHRREELVREQALARRIRTFTPMPLVTGAEKLQPMRPRPAAGMVVTSRLLRNLDRWLAQGGMKIPAPRFLLLIVLMGAATTALTALWVDRALAALYGAAAGAIPVGYVYAERKRRLTIFSQQLPYVLDFLRSALSAGHTLVRGVQMANENSPEPMSTELRLVVDQIQLGSSLAEALDSMFRRVPEESLGFLVAAVRVQSEVGSSISEILDRITDSIRSRQRLQQEIKTLTAQARMSGMIVAALPFLLLGLFTLVRPNYTYPLFHNPLGKRMLEGAIALDAVAFIVIRRMMQVD